MDPATFLASCEGKWRRAAPAASHAMAKLTKRSGLTLPADYLEFLGRCNGGNGFVNVPPFYFRLWNAEIVVDCNQLDYEFAPGFFAFGNAGNGVFFAFDTREPQPWPILSIPDLQIDDRPPLLVANSFSDFLEHVAPPNSNLGVKEYVTCYQANWIDGVPCTEEEVSALERDVGVRLPAAYRAMLLVIGRESYSKLVGTDVTIGWLRRMQPYARELLEANGRPFELPAEAFVFLSHQGYQFAYFVADGANNDPAVYFYLEGRGAPEMLAERFSDWLVAQE